MKFAIIATLFLLALAQGSLAQDDTPDADAVPAVDDAAVVDAVQAADDAPVVDAVQAADDAPVVEAVAQSSDNTHATSSIMIMKDKVSESVNQFLQSDVARKAGGLLAEGKTQMESITSQVREKVQPVMENIQKQMESLFQTLKDQAQAIAY